MNIRIKTQIIVGLSFLTVLLIMVGSLGIHGIRDTADRLQGITVKDIKAVESVEHIRFKMEINRSQILQALQHNPAMEWYKLHDHQLSIHSKIIADTTAEINEVWAQYIASITVPDEKKLAEEWYETSGRLGIDSITKSITAVQENRWNDAEETLIRTINPTYKKGDVALAGLTNLLQKRSTRNSATVIADIGRAENLTIGALLLGVLLSSTVGVLLVRGITIPLNQSIDIAHRVAGGDLTCKIEVQSNNEIGQLLLALKNMNSSLAGIVHNVKSATGMIGVAAKEIAAGNNDLSSRTEQQAGSLEETASSMEELTSTVKQNSDNAHHANQLARSASEVAIKGGAVVSEVVSTMESINESAKKIVDIIGVIDGIAFQTNILALNAAVEAARAGEQGRGFAVVASEVRNLAQRSASAAKEIKGLIGDSVEKVSIGTRLVDQAGATMEEIVSSIKRVTDIMGEIASASQEQSAGIEQINQAVTQMDEMTQQNSALVEEASAAASALEEQAQNLASVISVFKVLDEQTSATTLIPIHNEPHAVLHVVPQRAVGSNVNHTAVTRKHHLSSPAC